MYHTKHRTQSEKRTTSKTSTAPNQKRTKKNTLTKNMYKNNNNKRKITIIPAAIAKHKCCSIVAATAAATVHIRNNSRKPLKQITRTEKEFSSKHIRMYYKEKYEKKKCQQKEK